MNIFVILNISDDSDERLVDGNFENWTGGNPDDWTKTEVGSSTVNQESSDLRPDTSGSSALRFDVDGSNSNVNVTQEYEFLPGVRYKISGWYKNSDPGKTCGIRIQDNATNVYLDSDGVWQASLTYIYFENSLYWRKFELEFTANTSYTTYDIYLHRFAAASSSIYFDDFSITRQDTFAAIQPVSVTFNGVSIQSEKTINNISSITIGVGEDGSYESNGCGITLFDSDGYFRGISSDIDKMLRGRQVDIYTTDMTKINQYYIRKVYLPLNLFDIEMSDQWAELGESLAPDLLTESEYPNANPDAYGTAKTVFFNNFEAPVHAIYLGKNTIRCFLVEKDSGRRFFLGQAGSSISSLEYVFDPDGSDITNLCSLVSPSGGDPNYYIDKTTNPLDYVTVNFTYNSITAEEMLEEIGNTLFENFTFNLTNISAMLSGAGFDDRAYGHQAHYAVTEQVNRSEILRELCEAWGMEYYVKNGEIVFNIINYLVFYSDYALGQNEIIDIEKPDIEYSEIPNRININLAYDYATGEYDDYSEYDDMENRKVVGEVINRELNSKVGMFVKELVGDSHDKERFTAKHICIDNRYSKNEIRLVIAAESENETAGIDIVPFKILKFSHSILEDSGDHLFYVRRVEHDIMTGHTVLYVRDYTYLSAESVIDGISLNTECYFHLQSNNENGAGRFVDISPSGHNMVRSKAGNVVHDSTYTLFGTTSMNFTGASDYYIHSFPASRNDIFNIFIDLTTPDVAAVAVYVWVRFNAPGSVETICSQYVDDDNYWRFRKKGGDTLSLLIVHGGVERLNISTAASITDTNFHHVILYRTNAALALYIDGAQVYYDTTSLDYLFAASLYVGYDEEANNLLDGQIECVKIDWITDQNWHGLNPNVGLTDTYVVPSGLYSQVYRKYYSNKNILSS